MVKVQICEIWDGNGEGILAEGIIWVWRQVQLEKEIRHYPPPALAKIIKVKKYVIATERSHLEVQLLLLELTFPPNWQRIPFRCTWSNPVMCMCEWKLRFITPNPIQNSTSEHSACSRPVWFYFFSICTQLGACRGSIHTCYGSHLDHFSLQQLVMLSPSPQLTLRR